MFFIRYILFFSLSNVIFAYLWLDQYALYEVPAHVKAKIKEKHREYCTLGKLFKDVWKNSAICGSTREMFTGKFDKKLKKLDDDFGYDWNTEGSFGLNTLFNDVGFKQLPIGYSWWDTLYMFDPIDERSMADYRLTFSDLSIVAKHLENDSMKSMKTRKLYEIVYQMVKSIDLAANNVYSSRMWTLHNLYGSPQSPLVTQASLLNNFARGNFNDGFYKTIKLEIQKFQQFVKQIKRANLKDSLLHAIDVYRNVVRLLYEEILKEIDRKNNVDVENIYREKMVIFKARFSLGNCFTETQWIFKLYHEISPERIYEEIRTNYAEGKKLVKIVKTIPVPLMRAWYRRKFKIDPNKEHTELYDFFDERYTIDIAKRQVAKSHGLEPAYLGSPTTYKRDIDQSREPGYDPFKHQASTSSNASKKPIVKSNSVAGSSRSEARSSSTRKENRGHSHSENVSRRRDSYTGIRSHEKGKSKV